MDSEKQSVQDIQRQLRKEAYSLFRKKQYKEALAKYLQLDKKDAKVELYIGCCYYDGLIDGRMDGKKAVEWWTKAADHGCAEALYHLGCCYQSCELCIADDSQLNELLCINEETGEEHFVLDNNYQAMCYKKAIELYTKAAEGGYNLAQFALGNCYFYGGIVYAKCFIYEGIIEQDYAKAVKWYEKALGNGYKGSFYNLATCYMRGQGVDEDIPKAISLLKDAAKRGDGGAQNDLGVYYIKGDGVEQDFGEAVKWYRKAAKQGLACAQDNLGVCYECGRGVVPNFKKALGLYTKAADQGYENAIRNKKRLEEKLKAIE